jgi:D-sedoheptulose 7-phosphate isomerase
MSGLLASPGLIPASFDLSTDEHLHSLRMALDRFDPAARTAGRWGAELAEALVSGARLFVAGNGGSAAQAEHLSGEIVGRYCDDRRPFSAVALHADGSASTAIANDYGWEEVYARQLEAHARPGDVAVLMSTSGRSPNMVEAARRARRCGVRSWAFTGPAPNPLADACDDALTVPAARTATVQELHLVALHLLCAAFDAALAGLPCPAGDGRARR